MNSFLPTTKEEMSRRGWDRLDIIIVTGDAYVDHPSYGAAMIGRVLESEGFRVGIIAQPDVEGPEAFMKLGKPELFFGVTAGNLDSMIANYTANKKLRGEDEYSPGGKAGLRPDRATLIYTNRIRQAFGDIPIVIGGIEASMRRLAHYDYWSDKVRRSILPDSKADILVYGMGERQVVDIAKRLKSGGSVKDLDDIRGTVIIRNSAESIDDAILLPSFDEASSSGDKFNEAVRLSYLENDPVRGRPVIQPHDGRFVIQHPPAKPLSIDEMDAIYGLPFTRKPHPSYAKAGGVPGFETIKFSIISHRGCPGECSFCSLFAHQGRIVQSRSARSILREIGELAARADFNGTITDIGGPTANLYEAHCRSWDGTGACKGRRCLVPERCDNLKLGYDKARNLWKEAMRIPRVKYIFIGSGLRYDLLCDRESDAYLRDLCNGHISGQMKVAPEHSQAHVLSLMRKPQFSVYEGFVKRFSATNKALSRRQYLVNYFIVGHPGATLEDSLCLALKLKQMRINPEQVQDFIPLPMTISGAMYYTERDPFSGEKIYVAKRPRERRLQRALMQSKNIDNKRYVIEALRSLKKMDLMKEFYG